MALPGWTGAPLHGLAGAAIVGLGAAIGLYPGPLALLAALVGVGGWLREKVQHLPFRDPLTTHQRLEAAAWGLGAAGAWGVARFVL